MVRFGALRRGRRRADIIRILNVHLALTYALASLHCVLMYLFCRFLPLSRTQGDVGASERGGFMPAPLALACTEVAAATSLVFPVCSSAKVP